MNTREDFLHMLDHAEYPFTALLALERNALHHGGGCHCVKILREEDYVAYMVEHLPAQAGQGNPPGQP